MINQGLKMMMTSSISQSYLAGQLRFLSAGENNKLYRSTDYGANYSTINPIGGYYNSIACSSGGKYVTIGMTGYIYVSSDYGASFTQKSVSKTWRKVVVSDSGQYQFAINTSTANEYIYKSSDYGASWTTVGSLGYRDQLCISGDGKYLLTVNSSNVERVYKSSNYGASWSFDANLTDGYYIGLAINSNGLYQFVGYYDNSNILISSDYTASWSASSTSITQASPIIGCSASGQYVLTSDRLSNLYLSSNYGSTFSDKASTYGEHNFNIITNNGLYMLADGRSGNVWQSSNTGSTFVSKTITTTDIISGAMNRSDT